MDAKRKADLARILENRRVGKRLKNQASIDGRQVSSSPVAGTTTTTIGATTTNFTSPPRGITGVAVPDTVETPLARESLPEATTVSATSQQTVGADGQLYRNVAGNTAEVGALHEQVNSLQQQLVESQREQHDHIAQLQANLLAVQASIHSPGKKSRSPSHQRSSVIRSRGMTVPVPRLVPQPMKGFTDFRQPVYDTNYGAVSPAHAQTQSRALTVPAQQEGGDAFPYDPNQQYQIDLPVTPQEPPIAARPMTSRKGNHEGATALLSAGDWFLKWNVSSTDCKPNYVWLDQPTNRLMWGKMPKKPSAMSTFVPMEQIQKVTTATTMQHYVDGTRVWYVLFVHCPNRVIKLGTERQDKLNAWYDALRSMVSFYRMAGRQQNLYRISSSD